MRNYLFFVASACIYVCGVVVYCDRAELSDCGDTCRTGLVVNDEGWIYDNEEGTV